MSTACGRPQGEGRGPVGSCGRMWTGERESQKPDYFVDVIHKWMALTLFEAFHSLVVMLPRHDDPDDWSTKLKREIIIAHMGLPLRDVNKDLTPKDQDKDNDMTPKDQGKDKDLTHKDKDHLT